MTIIILLIVFFIALILQALFAGYETGFVSSNAVRIKNMAEDKKAPNAQYLLSLLHKPDRTLTMLLIGTNICVVVATITVTHLVGGGVSARNEALATLIVSPMLLIFAEIIPKTLFRKHPTRLSLALIPVIRILHLFLAPIVIPVALATKVFLGILGVKEQHVSPFMASLEDMRVLVDESAAQGAIEREEQEMIHSVIDLDTMQAKELMVPRIDIQSLPETATRQELIELFEETGRTRIPIYRENIDEVVGIINVFDVVLDEDCDNEGIGRFMKGTALHVPDTMKADDLLTLMRSKKQHLAIVTDEYGGTDGLITMEDILEEIFGEILDEYDEEEQQILKVGPSAYVVDARISLEDVAEELKVTLSDKDVETVGGWVMHLAERIPARGEVIEKDGFRITVLEADKRRLERIRLEMLPFEIEETD